MSKVQIDILANLHPIYGFLPEGGALSKLVLKSPQEKTLKPFIALWLLIFHVPFQIF